MFACVRHLLTPLNQLKILQGRQDIPILSPTLDSLADIDTNRTRLEALGPFDVVLVSRLQRTQQTALHYGFRDQTIEPLLDEFDFGEFTAKTKSELLESPLGPSWVEDPRTLRFGESIAELEERLKTFVHKYQKKKVLLFGHGTWIRGLHSLAREGDLRAMNRFSIKNNELLLIDPSPDSTFLE